MAATKYTYSVSQDFPNHCVNPSTLSDQIRESAIVTALDYINVTGDDCDIWFKDALSVGDKTILDGIVATHSGAPTPAVADPVTIENFATLDDPNLAVQRVVVQPGRTGYYMCDRDVQINTAIYAAADAFQDLKVTVSNNKQVAWNEFSFVGCYKLVAGDYVLVTDQSDADVNAVLSVYDFIAKNQTTGDPIEYDFKGGCLWSDNDLAEPVWEHRLYCIMAPNIPAAYGGSIRFFDGYLYPYQGKWQEAINTLALTVNPAQTVEAARTRFWIYYPAGAKHNHVLRVITYRKPETF